MKQTYYFRTQQMDVGYDGKPLIREISIGVRRGEIVTLIGPNGAGKSTILKSIARQLKILGGAAYIDGQNMAGMTAGTLAKKQAVVLTQRVRPELMNCFDVAAAGRYPYTGALGVLSADDRKAVWDALRMVEADSYAGRDFNAVSDGQRQRVLLARAICQEPDMIILDEPVSYLDIHHKVEFLVLLRKMAAEKGIAVIMSLHELDLAQKISDQVICVKGERIRKCGAPEEIFNAAYMNELFDIRSGGFHPLFGTVLLPAPEGKPEVFVIAGGGSGIPVFAKLQRSGVPFAAGILQENDIDYEAARYMAAGVVSAPAFEDPGADIFDAAMQTMRSCRKVLCPLRQFGRQNEYNLRLREHASSMGILCDG